MRDDGIRRAAVFTTSAWGGYSGCTQYVEDIARGRAGRRRRAHRSWSNCGSTTTIRCSCEMFSRRGRRRRRALPVSSATAPGWCSPHTRFRWRPVPVVAQTFTRARSHYAARLVADGRGLRRLRPGVAVALRAAAGAVAGTRRRRSPRRSGRAGTKAVDRLPDRFRRRPHRGGLGSRQRAAAAGRSGGHRVRAGRHAQRRPPLRAACRSTCSTSCATGREPSGRGLAGPEAPPLQGFSINGALCTPECGSASARRNAGSR